MNIIPILITFLFKNLLSFVDIFYMFLLYNFSINRETRYKVFTLYLLIITIGSFMFFDDIFGLSPLLFCLIFGACLLILKQTKSAENYQLYIISFATFLITILPPIVTVLLRSGAVVVSKELLFKGLFTVIGGVIITLSFSNRTKIK